MKLINVIDITLCYFIHFYLNSNNNKVKLYILNYTALYFFCDIKK